MGVPLTEGALYSATSASTHQLPLLPPALSTEGIFRRSANTTVVREVQQKYNMGECP